MCKHMHLWCGWYLFLNQKTHPLRQQNPLCSQIMKYSISRLLYYYKYNSRKTYFRINFFWLRGSELFWGGSQLSKEARVVRALKIQSDSLGSSPCFVPYDLRQVPSPLWTCFCIAKWGKCLPCWVSLWWCTWIHWIYCKVLYNIIYTYYIYNKGNTKSCWPEIW